MSPTIYLSLHSGSLHDTLMLLTTDYDNLVTRCVLANNSSYAINCWLLQQGCLSQGKYHFRVQIGRRGGRCLTHHTWTRLSPSCLRE